MAKKQVCWTCERERERCRAVSTAENGEIEWCCPQCYRDLQMDKYIDHYRKGAQAD